MEAEAAKYIGAGLACFALIGAGIGIGNIFGYYLSGALRNPSAAPGQFTNLLIGFALAEATGLFGLLVALIAAGAVYILLSDNEQRVDDTPTVQAAVPQPTTATPTPTATFVPSATPMPTATPTLREPPKSMLAVPLSIPCTPMTAMDITTTMMPTAATVSMRMPTHRVIRMATSGMYSSAMPMVDEPIAKASMPIRISKAGWPPKRRSMPARAASRSPTVSAEHAEAMARKNFPESGNYRSAGRQPAAGLPHAHASAARVNSHPQAVGRFQHAFDAGVGPLGEDVEVVAGGGAP